jgi:predicted DNA-binding transcriptional regulator AlpA
MKINTLDEIAERGRISRKTLDREFARGKGPALVRLSPRRVGVTEDDFQEWIRSRRQIQPAALETRG